LTVAALQVAIRREAFNDHYPSYSANVPAMRPEVNGFSLEEVKQPALQIKRTGRMRQHPPGSDHRFPQPVAKRENR
jgi:hypothetical protein